MQKSVFIALSLCAVMGFTVNSNAQQTNTRRMVVSGNPNQDGKDVKTKVRTFKFEGGMAGLNLTEDQKTKLKEIRLNESKQLLQLRNQMGEKRAHLRTLETADKANMSDINKTIDEIGKLTGDMMKTVADGKQKIRNMLTDEQRVQFDSRGGAMGMMIGKGDNNMKNMMFRFNRNMPKMPQTGSLMLNGKAFDFNNLDLSDLSNELMADATNWQDIDSLFSTDDFNFDMPDIMFPNFDMNISEEADTEE